MLGLMGGDHSLGERDCSCPELTVCLRPSFPLPGAFAVGARGQTSKHSPNHQTSIGGRGRDKPIHPVPRNSMRLLKTRPDCRFTGKIHTMCLNQRRKLQKLLHNNMTLFPRRPRRKGERETEVCINRGKYREQYQLLIIFTSRSGRGRWETEFRGFSHCR